MSVLTKTLRWISKVGAYLVLVCLLLMTVLIVINVVGRFFDYALLGMWEMCGMLLAIAVGFAMVYATQESVHVSMNGLVVRTPKIVQRFLRKFDLLVPLGTVVALWVATVKWLIEGNAAETTDVLDIPLLPVFILWVLCLICMSLNYVVHMFTKRATEGI